MTVSKNKRNFNNASASLSTSGRRAVSRGKEKRRLTRSRSFWRKTAIIEGAVILGAGMTGIMVWKQLY